VIDRRHSAAWWKALRRAKRCYGHRACTRPSVAARRRLAASIPSDAAARVTTFELRRSSQSSGPPDPSDAQLRLDFRVHSADNQVIVIRVSGQLDIEVIGEDIYGLDRDGDGIACES
jgi:hypothetical protein